MAATRDWVNELAQSERALIQAMIAPNHVDPNAPTALSSMEHQVVDNGAVAVKCYTGSDLWRLDDETVHLQSDAPNIRPIRLRARRDGDDLILVTPDGPLRRAEE